MPKKRESEEERSGGAGWLFALGAGAGMAFGMYLARQGRTGAEAPADEAAPARDRQALRARGGRVRRGSRGHQQLTRLEDAVLQSLLGDDVLSRRWVEVGAVSPGVIELSGRVNDPAEAAHAVSTAARVPGVETVVNRLEVGPARPRRPRPAGGGAEWGGRVSGMGRRRQGFTDPDRPDDAQHIREVSLEHADREQMEEEGIAHSRPRMAARPGGSTENPTAFDEPELDNQSPYGKHAEPATEQTRELNASRRVGEGLTPGLELRLEQADVPLKPHAGERHRDGGRR